MDGISDDSVEVIKSNKGGLKIIHKGYMYTVHKKRQGGTIRWRCAQRSLHCKGSVSTYEYKFPKVNMPHNHLPDFHLVALARGKHEQASDMLKFLRWDPEQVLEGDMAKMKTKHRNKTKRLKVRTVSSYDPDFKKAVILYAEEKSTREARKLYGVSESNIRRWRKMKNDIYDKSEKKKTLNLMKKRSSSRTSPRKSYSLEPDPTEPPEQVVSDPLECQDYSSIDSMPLQQRMTQSPEGSSSSQPVLQSQPLSPTKLKVTRQSAKAAAAASAPTPPPKPESPKEPPNEEVCLRWNSHHSNMQSSFPNLLLREQYVDVTLVAEGQTLKCHRLILSSCSPYFEEVLQGITPYQHPVLFMRDIPFWILKSLCDFMYCGEVQIYQNKLQELLAVAEILKIKGLAGKSSPSEQASAVKDEKKAPEKTLDSTSKSNKIKYDKYNDKDQEEEIDPLDLLEPLYEEVEEKKPPPTPKVKEIKSVPVKKSVPKKIKKRKYSDHEPSPPPVFHFRKGTRSRPNVKIPKYYHNDYGNAKGSPSEDQPSEQPSTSATDPLLEISEIKMEPIDIEDNIVLYSDDEPMLQSVPQEDDSLGNFDNSADGTVTDSLGNTGDEVDVEEHPLAEDSLVEGNSREAEVNPLNVPLPPDEPNLSEDSTQLEEANTLESDDVDMANPLETSSVLGSEDVADEDKLDSDDGFHGFNKISLMQPIITEVRSLSDDICDGSEFEVSKSHIETPVEESEKMDIDSEELTESKDPLNISGDILPHLDTDNNPEEFVAVEKCGDLETAGPSQFSLVPENAEESKATEDLQPESVENPQELNPVEDPQLKSEEYPQELDPVEDQQAKSVEYPQELDPVEDPQAKSVEYPQELDPVEDPQAKSVEYPQELDPVGKLVESVDEAIEKPTEDATEFIGDIPGFESVDNSQDSDEIAKLQTPEKSLENDMDSFIQAASQEIVPESYENFDKDIGESSEKEVPSNIDDRSNSSQTYEFPSDMPILQPAHLEERIDDSNIPLEAPNITMLDNTLADTNMMSKDDDIDIISEMEKTIELLNEIGGRNVPCESFGNGSETQDSMERVYTDLQPIQMVDNDLENVNLSDNTDSNLFCLDTQTVDPMQSEEDLLADT